MIGLGSEMARKTEPARRECAMIRVVSFCVERHHASDHCLCLLGWVGDVAR